MPTSSAVYDRYRATRIFGSFDGLRCLAVLPVVWHHATRGDLQGALGRGPLGVDLFFALSGFLITTLLVREREGAGSVAVGAFMVRRARRIFPLYYVVLAGFALHAGLLPAGAPERAHFFRSLPFFATYTTNWFVDFAVSHPVYFAFSWSLAVEEQFYVLWPWLVKVSARFAAVAAAGLLVLDQLAERGALVAWLPPRGLGVHILASVSTPICLGALLAVALHHRRAFLLLASVLGHRASAPILLAVVSVCIGLPAPLLPTHVALTLLVGACAVREDNGLRALLTMRPVAHVGAVSYGVYMLHVAVTGPLKRIDGLGGSALAVFLIAVPASVALATLSHRTLESLFRRRVTEGPRLVLGG